MGGSWRLTSRKGDQRHAAVKRDRYEHCSEVAVRRTGSGVSFTSTSRFLEKSFTSKDSSAFTATKGVRRMQHSDYVAWTRSDFLGQMSEFDLEDETRPARFRHQQLAIGSKHFEIESEGWRIAGDRLCGRYARIRGAAMDIATVMVYPTASPEVFPVFAAEWVVFGDRVHALILDVEVCGRQPALVDRLDREFGALGEYWRARFPENRERPAWFEEIAMPWVLYGSCEVSRLSELRQAFNDYLATTIRSFWNPSLSAGRSGSDHEDVERYKFHHYENSPGHRLLGVKMGQKAADELLKDWHFGPARVDGRSVPADGSVVAARSMAL
ncbi:hypothetical protein HFP89_14395 [Wenzhouxiangella sp. XN79A]|uniref:hypothetical protein n=1 Tax=Wenzhouxiangella sp. XN79A TaxID=2724193 RepID=UPI00144AA352|nr:hypothetical protein [Wenzhouxiangella sp. XN79A]NKI36357.1 hypothetical protein [Wenzhouxiangella sp. XN79A]